MSHIPVSSLSDRLPVLAAGLLAVLLSGCQNISTKGELLGVITPYRVEVVQGNVVTSEQAAAVKPGMAKAQVRDVLGSPLITDAFHADRWDYVFTIRRQGTPPQLRRIVVLFKDDKLEVINTGGDLPSERDFVALIDANRPPSKPPSLMLTEEEIKLLPKPAQAAASEPVPAPPTRTYPPLESVS